MGLVDLNLVERNRRPSCEDVGASEGRRGRDEEGTGFAVNERRSRSGRKRVSETMHSQTADDAVRETKEEGSEARREASRARKQAKAKKPSRRGKKANTTASASQSNQTFIHKREVGGGRQPRGSHAPLLSNYVKLSYPSRLKRMW
jgi:FKBP-type peptidyl-prolyl cis-trans isomerase